MRTSGVIATALLALSGLVMAGCASNDASGPPRRSEDIMSGGRYEEPWLSKFVKEAAAFPLGSDKNPVRTDGPPGQRAYLMRLRCADGKAPTFGRTGNLGGGVFGSIVDLYDVRCVGSSPAQTDIIMDMYFGGYKETQAVPGFTITPP